MIILPYKLQPIEYLPYDANLPKVAELVSRIIIEQIPGARSEHIGSTAVVGMPGKNIINLVIPSNREQFAPRLQLLERLRFGVSPLNKPEPSYRPLRVASVEYRSKMYNVHVHLIVDGSDDLTGARFFRDYLIQNPHQQTIYAKIKEQAVQSGKTDAASYNAAKSPFIQSILVKMGSCAINPKEIAKTPDF